jgi:hypothetical protein
MRLKMRARNPYWTCLTAFLAAFCASPAWAANVAFTPQAWPDNIKPPVSNNVVAEPAIEPQAGNALIGTEEAPEITVVATGEPSGERRIVGIEFVDSIGVRRICSGLYLDTLHVLTAKHCTCHQNDYRVTNDKDMFSPTAVWTDAVVEPSFRGGARCDKISDFNPEEGNDIAILTLKVPLRVAAETVTSACYSLVDNIRLLDVWRKARPRRISIAGFGATHEDGSSSGIRNSTNVAINSTDCATDATRSLGCVAYREMILGLRKPGEGPADSCPGDSGGPAYIVDNGEIMPVGIVSRSVNVKSASLCGGGGIYTLLGRTDIIAWLHKRLPGSGRSGCEARSAPAGGAPEQNFKIN